MKTKWYTHLPAVKMDNPASCELSYGSLTNIDFDTWYGLDGTFGYNRKHFEKSNPLFFIGELDYEPGDDKDIFAEPDKINRLLYWAITLRSQPYLIPNPLMSCTYYLFDTEIGTGTQKRIGSFEREWIVFGDYFQFPFSKEMLENIKTDFAYLIKCKDFTNQYLIMEGLRVLQFTANPDICIKNNKINYFNGFVHCMAILEAILVPGFVKKKYDLSITSAFGSNAAAFRSPEFENIKETALFYSEMYRIRSKIIHGEAGSGNYTQNVENGFKVIRILLSEVLQNLIALHNIGFDLTTIPDIIIKASKEKESHKKLFSLIADGNSNES